MSTENWILEVDRTIDADRVKRERESVFRFSKMVVGGDLQSTLKLYLSRYGYNNKLITTIKTTSLPRWLPRY